MHKLDRGSAPTCLRRYDYKKDDWGTVMSAKTDEAKENRTEIWKSLHEMQGNRCAYCESDLGNQKCHIEHFRQRKSEKGRPAYRQGTYEWSNLFGCCFRENSCGNHKDKKCFDYDYRDLIKPDIDNPDDYFIFVGDGSIDCRDDLEESALKKAQETIRVFNLNDDDETSPGSLRFMRSEAVEGYKQTADYFAELARDYPEEEWRPLLQDEIDKTASLPYATAIRHVLTI